tara:strand:- start:1349 stop:1489 length:141 start_codon:yes stop_codon:yes gene_type:complete
MMKVGSGVQLDDIPRLTYAEALARYGSDKVCDHRKDGENTTETHRV